MKVPFFNKKTSDKAPVSEESSRSDQTANTSSSQEETADRVLEATIQIIQQVTGFVPLDIAKNVLKGITSILLLLQKNIQNKAALTGLARRCDAICSTLAQAAKDVSMDDISDALSGALRSLKSSIDELHSNVIEALQRGRIRRLVGATLDEKQIIGWTGELDSTLTLFSASVNIVSGIRSEQTYSLLKHRDVSILKPDVPPAPPAMFFGREELFIEVRDALLRDEDVALIGPGGIGKSTIAKALVNDKDIRERYARRFFVSYDGMDPVTITLGSFVDRIAGLLGLPMRGAESKQQVLSNLASSPVLIVLDNAETFEDAADLDTMEQISSTVSEIANTEGVTVILTSRTSRNARDADWTQVDVPPLDKVPASQYFKRIYRGDIADTDVDKMLGALDFHPLSIRIVAYAARESRWTAKELLDNWQVEKSKLLQTGRKKESLWFTIQLSLNSPSVKNLGDDALNVLRIIAFFPQGVNRNHVARLFPSIPTISSLLDTLCNVSLVYRSGPFFATLAPIRLFLLSAVPNTQLDLVGDIRHTYYDSLEATSEEKDPHADLIIADHLNIEHLIAYDIMHPPDSIRNAARACNRFLWGLMYHKLRPTSLTPLILCLPEGSHEENYSKACCLDALAQLHFELSNFSLSGTTFLAAHTLFITTGNHTMASNCISNAAMSYNNRGYYARARQLLENFVQSSSWQHVDAERKSEVHYTLDVSRMHTSHDNANELFLSSMDHPFRGLESRVSHWQVRMHSGFSTPQEVERNLEPIRSCCMSSRPWNRWLFLAVLAEAAFLRGRFEVAMELLNQAHDTVNGDFMLTLIVLYHQAALASVQGNYAFARSRLQHSLDTLSVIATPSSTDFLEMRYVHGRNELYANNYSEAHRLLATVITDCDIQGNIRARTRSVRTLGEVQLLMGCKSDSDGSFAQTVELCNEAGVPPELLDICDPLLKLDDDEFPGWKTYLQARVGQ